VTRSTVPGYLAVAAAFALAAAAPVTGVLKPGGTPCDLDEVAAAWVADAVLGVLVEEPHPARRPPTATAAPAPARVLGRRRKIWSAWMTCIEDRRAVREWAGALPGGA
jgi:hypothetical protein